MFGQGSNACIVTLVERKTGFLIIGKLPNKSTASLNKKVISIIRRHPGLFRTITADNGTEFHNSSLLKAEESGGRIGLPIRLSRFIDLSGASPVNALTHIALDDAIEQGALFCKILEYGR